MERFSIFVVDHRPDQVGKELVLKMCDNEDIRGTRMSIKHGDVLHSVPVCVTISMNLANMQGIPTRAAMFTQHSNPPT